MKTLISTQSKFISYIIQCTLALLLSTSAQAQNIGINTLTADASSILDITHTTRGLLIPRIPLTSANDITTIVMPALSLLIFNTATAGIIPNNVKPGYYYFNGTKWVGIGTGVAWDLMGNLGTTAGTNFIGTIDAQDLVFKTNSLENMRILNSNGNVGIGTNSPLVNLDVLSSGNTNINVTSDGNFSILSATSYSTIGSPYFIGLLAQGTKLTPTYPTTGKILTYFAGRDAIDGRLGSAYGGGQIRIVTDENFTSVDKGTFMDFSTTQRGTNLPVERVTITSNGNVGIGTAFPANLLSNIPASSTYANVSSENTGQQAGKSLSWYNDISGFSAAFINTGILNGSNGVQIRTAGNSASQKILALGTGVSSIPNANTEIMTVLGNGNVGIGTTTPATKLHLLDGQITQ
ncbi:MAG: hypothetical protein H7331_06830, partial [Bacteroidia bacterium]|nr:hypothetical protein [Bacteroidia bacterium]